MLTKWDYYLLYTVQRSGFHHQKSTQPQATLLGASNTNASKEYGINRNACLNELRYNLNGWFKYTLTQFCDLVVCRYFHVCDGGLVPDIMHDLLEGAMQYEVKFMLKKMIEIDKYFSLADIKTMHYTKLL